ncbi:antibiotic biosynthesis monooxygenase family protein [Litoreibacter arenae]|uniref:Antibiotic biosynthesis monooxygenase n=1 Tax=Litoreibacter arenae DSM 19593 TaxID=1123360 RepID=S9QKV4_9RHOB|nr:antibiotic biosynthesis monooxygenase [Litoreibacter arenae]EPX80228.1 Antibiotic biosynthesis monooxygenase [Litoreibacter arenae DSM 19593]
MIAVIFEVIPAEGRKTAYLDIAADLRPLLEQVDGFISVERFQSITDPSKMLSLSFFRDEDALANWRTLSEHRSAQKAGRSGVFEGYRLRIGSVIRDYGLDERRDQAPADSNEAHGCPYRA